MTLYCTKCRDLLSHSIAGYKNSPDGYKQVKVTGVFVEHKIECVCERCGHKWLSVSKNAKKLLKIKNKEL